MSGAKFSKIIILQSLPENDEFTGTKLHDDLNTFNTFHDFGLEVELININSRSQLLTHLEKVEVQTRDEGVYPILHLEIHGSTDTKGIVLSSNEYISWDDLKNPLTKINIASKLNLVITLAVCYGAHLMQIIQLTDRAPCWGLIGPVSQVSTGSVLNAFYGFYRSLIESEDGRLALEVLNKRNNENTENSPYNFTHAESYFKEVFKKYQQEELTPIKIDKTARRLYRRTKKERGHRSLSVGQFKRLLKNTQEEYFYKYRDRFFMFDLYEENKSRFEIEFTDVAGNTSP